MRALISVFDKTNIEKFATELVSLGWEIISTGGTYNLLKNSGLEVMSVEEVTNFPEMLDGRVKTLNPKIHGAILYKRNNEDHVKAVKEFNIESIDMIVNNLYPFEKTLNSTDVHEEIIEMIDIGGPSMIRAAAKNYEDVLCVTDINDYEEIIEKLKDKTIDNNYRRKLAGKAFETTAKYDLLISKYLLEKDKINLEYNFSNKLRYGENPHQKASYYEVDNISSEYKANIKKLHGKEISYNNLVDIYACVKAVKTFDEPACVAVKHTNPCGIGTGKDSFEAYTKAYECDSESIFGGIVGFNREVDKKCAEEMSKIFLEIIIAPKFSEEAIEILTEKKNIRLIEIDNICEFKIDNQFKQVLNGIVIQDYDDVIFGEELKVMTKRIPTEKELEDLKFAWACCKNVASNGVVIAKDGATVGIGQGQTKRSWAVEEAIERSGEKITGSVMASDGFFFVDTMELLNDSGIISVIQPGGSIKDKDVIEYADANDMTVIFTGVRHFRH